MDKLTIFFLNLQIMFGQESIASDFMTSRVDQYMNRSCDNGRPNKLINVRYPKSADFLCKTQQIWKDTYFKTLSSSLLHPKASQDLVGLSPTILSSPFSIAEFCRLIYNKSWNISFYYTLGFYSGLRFSYGFFSFKIFFAVQGSDVNFNSTGTVKNHVKTLKKTVKKPWTLKNC